MTLPITDTKLRDNQYATPINLSARVSIHQRFSTNPQGWHAWLWEQLALQPGDRVLEVGCGEGSLWSSNAHRLPPELDLTLTDFSAGMLAATEAKLRPILPDAVFDLVDAQAIPYPDASFDLVIANHMLYHVPDKPRAIAEIWRVLKPDGRFIAATNGRAHMTELTALAEQHDPGNDLTMDDSFTLEDGGALLAERFRQVQRRDYPDGLEVTDPEAIIAYIRSSGSIPSEALTSIRSEVAATIAKRGSFPITKSTGVFLGSGVIPGSPTQR